MEIITKCLENNTEIKQLKKAVSDHTSPVLVSGMAEAQKAHIATLLGKSRLIVASSPLKARQIHADLCYFDKTSAVLYPPKDIIFYSADIKSRDIIKTRFEILSRLMAGEELTVVATVEALLDRLVPRGVFESFILTLRTGGELKMDDFAKRLVLMGYERCDSVEGPGQFAIRGGIVDVFSSVAENAVRIELWGDEIDSIRIMDSLSQRSVENITQVTLYPISELIYEDDRINKAVYGLKKALKTARNTKLQETLEEVIERLENEKFFPGVEKYINFFYDETAQLPDYMPENTVVIYDEPNRVREHCENILAEFTQSIEARIAAGQMLPEQLNTVYGYEDVLARTLRQRTVLFSALLSNTRDFKPKLLLDLNVKSSPTVQNNSQVLFEDLEYMYKHGYTVLLLGGGLARCERLLAELRDRDIPSVMLEEKDEYSRGVVYVGRGSLSQSFEYVNDKFAVISLNEQSERKRRRRRSKKDKTAVIESFNDLKIGDYVVHENYGIGVFMGIEQRIVENAAKDYIKIGYADESYLYITPNRLDYLQKYIGSTENGQGPKLSKMGGSSWSRAKARAKQAASILAKDLLELYAKRQAAKGYIYGSDTVWQREFEEAFPYEETQDQLDAIADVKKDMEQGRVMDRLICGDVGFGKTEVALRAAFKTVQEGRQVAYLVPTTILANQHYQTFASRLAGYPVTVELLNRFRTQKEQKQTVKGISTGAVDIVIGTHRLLSKDVSFKNLGLVIVDEEQRFGVSHKEKLKKLRSDANILTLTATPIPRTLHMSLSGIRDMSLLTEPPNDRIPIQTYVMEYDPELVR
ncbi:MAG: DEAD/DEAH box helicase, partial [Firmicutes bacterium]|nr:DEAD/DEAH box helicase [Bacillota bacterium]